MGPDGGCEHGAPAWVRAGVSTRPGAAVRRGRVPSVGAASGVHFSDSATGIRHARHDGMDKDAAHASVLSHLPSYRLREVLNGVEGGARSVVWRSCSRPAPGLRRSFAGPAAELHPTPHAVCICAELHTVTKI
ncbi:uncharacterized protein [Miscanthus floridulus]|uniref:uncharacterized protein n=1 Tax=Miscanthus floridulus TaxID=154761 RepID=UPI0034575B56